MFSVIPDVKMWSQTLGTNVAVRSMAGHSSGKETKKSTDARFAQKQWRKDKSCVSFCHKLNVQTLKVSRGFHNPLNVALQGFLLLLTIVLC